MPATPALLRLLGGKIIIAQYISTTMSPHGFSTPLHTLPVAAAAPPTQSAGCNVYISEGRNVQLIRQLEVIMMFDLHAWIHLPALRAQQQPDHHLCSLPSVQAVCSQQHPRAVVLANTFIDEPYNRTGLTLASTSIPEVCMH